MGTLRGLPTCRDSSSWKHTWDSPLALLPGERLPLVLAPPIGPRLRPPPASTHSVPLLHPHLSVLCCPSLLSPFFCPLVLRFPHPGPLSLAGPFSLCCPPGCGLRILLLVRIFAPNLPSCPPAPLPVRSASKAPAQSLPSQVQYSQFTCPREPSFLWKTPSSDSSSALPPALLTFN